MKFLGHVVSRGGISVDPVKVEVVSSWHRLTNVTEIRSFLGLAGNYRCFIQDFSHIASPLTHLTQKGVPFIWNDRCEEAFNELKYRLTTAPVLALPERGLGYTIYYEL